MAGNRTTEVRFHEGVDVITLMLQEWPDSNREMLGPVVYGRRASATEYRVDVLVPAKDERFDIDPFDRAQQQPHAFVIQAIQGDPVERRRRERTRRYGPPNPRRAT